MNLTQKTSRIEVADVLRGFAVMAIVVLHAIEHFNFYTFPDTTNQGAFLNFTDKAIWDGMFFAFGGKAYAIFALLFGFSFYIQDHNQLQKGKDFRLRFCWRLVLLFVLGNINAVFFTAEVLVLYSIVGFILPLTCRMKDKALFILACILLLQPLHLIYTIISVVDLDFVVPTLNTRQYWDVCKVVQAEGNFLQMAKVNLWEGQLASLTWAWDNARFFQSAALFLFGLLIGRRQLLKQDNISFWYKAIALGALCFFPLTGLRGMITNEFFANKATVVALKVVLKSLSNFAFAVILVSSIIIAYYNSKKLHKLMTKLIPYGKMSLTNYLTQSMIGGFIFYNWGLGLYDVLGITYSWLVGIALFFIQLWMCKLWLSKYKQGPFEYLWKRATWLK